MKNGYMQSRDYAKKPSIDLYGDLAGILKIALEDKLWKI